MGKKKENEEGNVRHNHNLPFLVLYMHNAVNPAQDAPWQRNKQPPLEIEPRTFSLHDGRSVPTPTNRIAFHQAGVSRAGAGT